MMTDRAIIMKAARKAYSAPISLISKGVCSNIPFSLLFPDFSREHFAQSFNVALAVTTGPFCSENPPFFVEKP
jgi:hypothetical protein